MLKKKIIAVVSVLLLLSANVANAFKQDYTPNDKYLASQIYLNAINITPSWSDELKVNKEVVVAVLDSGMDLTHPDLVDNIWTNSGEIPNDGLDNDNNSYVDDVYGWNFVASNNNPQPDIIGEYDFVAANHGTIVAGIIAAQENMIGIVGIAPQVKIMPLKILDGKGSGNILVLSQAIKYAVENGADIINLSLVGNNVDKVLADAIVDAYNRGVMIVAASGNEKENGVDLDVDPRYPVCEVDNVNRVLGVAALDSNKKLSPFSNYGEKCIDISAPGNNFFSTVYHNDNNLDFNQYYSGGWSGTSVAAPTVTATAALIKMMYPDLRPYDIYTIIKASAQDLQQANPFDHKKLGSGLLDVGAALNMAASYFENTIKIVMAPEAGLPPEVLLLDDKGQLESSFLAYSKNFKGGVNVTTGAVAGDGHQQIVTAPMAGGGPHLRVFNRAGNILSEFFAYDSKFTGGVNLAVGNLNSDQRDEIVTAPLSGVGPVRVFDNQGNLLSEFIPYDSKFTGGVNLAVGDVNNDGLGEIVTAPRTNHGPDIKVFTMSGRLISNFSAYESTWKSGVSLTVGDVNNDKWPEIVTVPAKGHSPDVRVFGLKGRLKSEFVPYSKYLTTGIKILATDISGDKLPEILTLPNQGSTSLLRIFDSSGLEKNNYYLRNPHDRNGYNFSVLNK
ncbi:MAG: hypothetical protein C3F02_04855 [Parcubacteria group bacterium]|nr:MAG: hypothetical protein C3F02_04855 [Parcubacteria group bacterium]